MKKGFSRWMAVLLTVCMLLSLFPGALAASPVTYVQDTDGVDSGGVYAIYTNEADDGNNNRILYHTGSGKTDKVTGSVNGDQLSLNGGFTAARQLWTITAVTGGYTVQSVDSGRYLDLSQDSASNLATSDQAVTLTITLDEATGLYTIASGDRYLSFDPSGNTAFQTGSTGYGLRLYQQTEETTTEQTPPPQGLPTAVTYVQDTDGIDSGAVYVVFYDGTSNGSILYHTGTGVTDQVGGSVSGNQLNINSGFDASCQTWTITQVGDGYTVQSVDSGYYLDLTQTTTSKVNTSAVPVSLNIALNEDGTYSITGTSGNALSHGATGQFYSGTEAAPLHLYKYTEVEPDTASGAPSGTSQGQPFVTGSSGTGSNYFRIPALLTLDNGWIVAASDIRWRTSGDSPQNLDTIVSVSKDGGDTWDWEVVNYYDDMADNATGQASASFIDPSILQAEDGTIHMVVDACPSYVGLMGGNRMGWESSGFDDEGRLLVSCGTAGGDASTRVSDYTYYVDINNASAGQSKTVDGETRTLYPICNAADDSETGYYVDAWLNLYYERDGAMETVWCLQQSSADKVQANLFYRNSQWKAYPVFYIMHRSATVTDEGLVWSDPQFLDIKLAENEAFTGVCPGRGLSFQYKGHERLVFPLYDNATGTELASVIYSDDGGKTWTRGQHNDALNGVGKTSESQVVTLSDGTLRMYSRNTIGYISYADSTDGGVTWGTCQKDMDLTYTGNCMVSFINLDGILVGPDNAVYENLILASYPKGSSGNRTDGVVRIGYVDDGNVIRWLNSDATRFSGGYSYSCLTQLPEGDTFGLLYEYDPTTNTIGYVTLSVQDLLGEGWYLLDGIGALPSISLDQSVVSLNVGETAAITPTYTPADAAVTWTSSNPDAATVDGGVITAVAPGTATITAEVTSSGITRAASVSVAVQGGDGVVLPECYADQVKTTYHEESTTYELDTDGIDAGSVYAIFHSGSSRILYHANNAGNTDHVTGSAADRLLMLDSSYATTRQTWIVTGDGESGYTIQSCEADGRYLNLNAATNPGSRVPVTDESQALTITPVDGSDGSYTVSRVVDGQTLYLAHDNGTTQHYVSTSAVPFQFYRQVITPAGSTYATSAEGLRALIGFVETLDETAQTALQPALSAARTAAEASGSSYETEQEAEAAQQTITAAAEALYQAYLDLNKESYTVTFQVDGGTDVSAQTVEEGEKAVRPADPTRTDYRFDGWFTDAGCTQAYDFDAPVTGNLTLYAKWTYVGGTSTGGTPSGGTTTDTEKNPDGSTTTTVTRPNGTVTETTKWPDGSSEVVETEKDGTVTTTTTDDAGNMTEVVEHVDGSSVTTVDSEDGSSSTTTVDENGQMEAQVVLSAAAVEEAADKGEAVALPMPAVYLADDQLEAPTVTVALPSGRAAKVEIPVEDVTAGTVAVLVESDGSEEIIQNTQITGDGVAVTLSDGDTVRIVDNTKDFADVPDDHWGANAVDFVTSRQLFNGTGAGTFAPEADMTRAMIVTVLARYDGADTDGGQTWYEQGVQWAVANGVSDGTNLEDAVSREQLVTMLWRLAGSPVVESSLSDYPDGDGTSDWAVSAMTWAVENGIVTGTDTGMLNPQNIASRVEVAAILARFIELGA